MSGSVLFFYKGYFLQLQREFVQTTSIWIIFWCPYYFIYYIWIQFLFQGAQSCVYKNNSYTIALVGSYLHIQVENYGNIYDKCCPRKHCWDCKYIHWKSLLGLLLNWHVEIMSYNDCDWCRCRRQKEGSWRVKRRVATKTSRIWVHAKKSIFTDRTLPYSQENKERERTPSFNYLLNLCVSHLTVIVTLRYVRFYYYRCSNKSNVRPMGIGFLEWSTLYCTADNKYVFYFS